MFTDLSCIFKDNSVTALLGESGCGKTTLTHLLTRLYSAKEGEISVNNTSIYDYALDDYRKQFVVVSQNSFMFSGTIRENLTYGVSDVSEERLLEVLKQAKAYDFVMARPQGLDAKLDEYGGNLSGGQRQRLGIARALLSDAHYLILDEPVAAMDAIATAELVEVLKSVVEHRCVIVIAHSAAILPLATRAVVLKDGKVDACGELEEVAKTNAFLKDLIERSGN